jgi:uncharacterized membrane protein
MLPLEPPPSLGRRRSGGASTVVLQLRLPREAEVAVDDLPWSEGHAYRVVEGDWLELKVQIYNLGRDGVTGQLAVADRPEGWEVVMDGSRFEVDERERATKHGRLRVASGAKSRDGWVVLRANCGAAGEPVVAFRIVVEARPGGREPGRNP